MEVKELQQILEDFMLENNLGYINIKAMINVHKKIKMDIYGEPEDEGDFDINLDDY